MRLIWHRIFQPQPDDPLDFEATVERTLLEMRGRYEVRELRYDPYQLVAVAQRLTAVGLPMVEFPQTVPNLTEASTNLYELIKGRNLTVYPDEEMRLSVSHAVALETSRGWRIAKEKVSHKIDVVVALAQAALGVMRGQIDPHAGLREFHRQQIAEARCAPARGTHVCGICNKLIGDNEPYQLQAGWSIDRRPPYVHGMCRRRTTNGG